MKPHLLDLLRDCTTIATVGTCKNAGKTTVLNYLIKAYHDKKILAVTSIGYDGEARDAVTHLPKPRIKVYPGIFVATSSSCLKTTTTSYEQIMSTGIQTSIGQVVIVRILTEGIMEIAGPAMASQIHDLTDKLQELACTKVLVDGAAGRLSYGCYTDGTILSIGGAYSQDLKKVVRHGQHIYQLMTLQAFTGPHFKHHETKNIYQVKADQNHYYIRFRGTVVDEDLDEIGRLYKDKPIILIAKDPSVLFISPRKMHQFYHQNHKITLEHTMNLCAVTVNPMSPYGPWLDAIEMEEAMSQGITTPVYNIKNEKVNRYEE